MTQPLDEISAELQQCIDECGHVVDTYRSQPVRYAFERFFAAIREIDTSWSQSCLGYHASMYIVGFRRRKAAEFFDTDWGIGRPGASTAGMSKTTGEWRKYRKIDVVEAIKERAAPATLEVIKDTATQAEQAFARHKADLLATLDALRSIDDNDVVRELRQEVVLLPDRKLQSDFIKTDKLPVNHDSQDVAAKRQGVCIPVHYDSHAWLALKSFYGERCEKLMLLATRTLRYLEKKRRLTGSQAAGRIGNKIAVGHGRSALWRDLKDFLSERLNLQWDEFNRESSAGLSNKEVLTSMLNNAAFAFLVLTAEDEHADNTLHARENVIHEVGLFQGRLGFERAIILLEEGCSQFSNVHGLTQIRFPPGDIKAAFEEVRRVLEREKIITRP